MKFDVFISHSHHDKAVADAACAALENARIRCWIAPRNIVPGTDWGASIVDAIDGCRAIVLIFSSHANNSLQIRNEVTRAVSRGVPVIPVRIENIQPTKALAYYMGAVHWLDALTPPIDPHLRHLAASIEALLQIEPPAQSGTVFVTEPSAEISPVETREPEIEAFATTQTGSSERSAEASIATGAAPVMADLGHSTAEIKPNGDLSSKTEEAEKSAPASRVSPPTSFFRSWLTRKSLLFLSVPLGLIVLSAIAFPYFKGVLSNGQNVAPAPDIRGIEGKVPTPPRGDQEVVVDPAPPISPTPASSPILPAPVSPPIPRVLTKPPPVDAIGEGGQVFRDCADCPPMVVVPAGTAIIGSPSDEAQREPGEGPRQRIRIAKPFAVGTTAVSFAEWDACVAEGGCRHFIPTDMGWGRGDLPVIFVSWDDAKAYVKWLSDKTEQHYRLLSEAEWEYVARACRAAACQDSTYWFGNAITPERANYDWRYSYSGSPKAQALRRTTPVGHFQSNPFGVHDITGNVDQWVEDCWNPNLADLPTDGSAQARGDCTSHVLRGGSWSDEPKDLRSAARKWDIATSCKPQYGFRVARDLTN